MSPRSGWSALHVKKNFRIIRRINERGTTRFLVEQNVHPTLAISYNVHLVAKGRVVAERIPTAAI